MSEKEMIKELKEHCDELEIINQKVMEENEQLQQKWLESEYEKSKLVSQIDKMKETLKKVRVALIQERTANIMNYGKGGVEMFDNIFEVLKGVIN